MQGFIVWDKNFGPKYFEEHQKTVGKWSADGSFKPEIDVVEGIDNAGPGLLRLFSGENFGKAMIKIADLDADKTKSSL